jgi:anti-sigma B factor antagonist
MQHEITHPDDASAVVHLSGELDVSQTLAVRDLVLAQIGPGRRLIVDLGGVPFIDSSGIGMLVGAHRASIKEDAWFAVCGADATVTKVFELTRTNRVLRVFQDTAAALSAPTMEVQPS